MLYREIIAVCSEIHTKHISTLCGQNVEMWMLNLVVQTATTGTKQLSKEHKLDKTAYVAGICGFLNILYVSLLICKISV
jgi:hypothetical protein